MYSIIGREVPISRVIRGPLIGEIHRVNEPSRAAASAPWHVNAGYAKPRIYSFGMLVRATRRNPWEIS